MNSTPELSAELSQLADRAAGTLARLRDVTIQGPLQQLRQSCEDAARAWSGSNIGYHASVYCQGLRPKPPEALFSSEWGLADRWPTHQPHECWETMDRQAVIDHILNCAGVRNTEEIEAKLESIREIFQDLKENAISILSAVGSSIPETFLQKKLNEIEKLEAPTPIKIALQQLPKREIWSRDSLAMSQGLQLAPHQQLSALPMSAVALETAIDRLERASRISSSHLAVR